MGPTEEHNRVEQSRDDATPWKKWGPYLSERQWGTVREDYSENGDAWNYFTHDQARSRSYRWGEDGIAGVSDEKQYLCFALALWNGRDPILKERMFGLTNSQGNHGEDVKEYYFYLDSTPTHSYMKYLYKYPQAAYPYDQLLNNNRRSRFEFEYELLDTGLFNDDRYFDVLVEYAKASPEDILIRITASNRGPDQATLHLLPSLWFRNNWRWDSGITKPVLSSPGNRGSNSVLSAWHSELGNFELLCEGAPPLLFTENETNNRKLFGADNFTPYVKDAFHDYVVHQQHDAVNPAQTGTKAAALYELSIPGRRSATVRLRLTRVAATSPAVRAPSIKEFDDLFGIRIHEADEFYEAISPRSVNEDEARVMRQALSGMLWSKQFYQFDANRWLTEHQANPIRGGTRQIRNREWYHMANAQVISMPDKWEYPWYAAWDLAFHCIALSAVDVDFAKQQLALMLNQNYIHPNGQMPAYEWNYGDVNPPVHAWATLFIHRFGQAMGEPPDIDFLKRSFLKLNLNFNWWVNRKDRNGKNVFEGGFLGLDNIGIFDRSAALPTGGYLEQADGTAWMALFCQNMLELAVELAAHDPTFEDLALKYAEHFIWIALGMNNTGPNGMWDEEDGFYYDVLRQPDGSSCRLKVRSLVGLLPLCAATIIEDWQRQRVQGIGQAVFERVARTPELFDSIHATGPGHRGVAERGILALVNEHRLRRILSKMLDENEFLSPYGLRSISRYHHEHPYTFNVGGQQFGVGYLPAESDSGMFGGNSNWRGPIWMPINTLIIRALYVYYLYYGDNFKVECPTGSGRMMNLYEVANELSARLERIFLRDEQGRRPVFGGAQKFQTDPHWRDNILFYEYFHGDNGAGLGASHQTGWTGVIGRLIQLRHFIDPQRLLQAGVKGVDLPGDRPPRQPEGERPRLV